MAPLLAVILVLGTAAAEPAAVLELGPRQAHATPTRNGFALTGGGIIDVVQPTPDVIVTTMAGVAVAGAHPVKDSLAELAFEMAQHFEVKVNDAAAKNVRLVLEAQVIGLLRSHKCSLGSARIVTPAAAVVPCATPGGPALVEVELPGREVGPRQNLSVNDREGPAVIPVLPGRYILHQRFAVQAAHPHSLLPCKTAAAEFAPDPALDPLWIDAWEPFHGAIKKDCGFRVTLRVIAD